MQRNRQKPLWLKRLLLLVDAQESLWLPPSRPDASPREFSIHALRSEAHRLNRQNLADSPGTLALRSLAWPLLLPIKAWLHSRGSPHRLAETWQCILDLVLHNLRAGALQVVRSQRGHLPHLPRWFVSDLENQILTTRLHAVAAARRIGHKSEFTRFCAAQKLPTLPLLAEGNGGRIDRLTTWPESDLFIKPASLYGGKGVAVLRHDADHACWKSQDGEAIDAGTFSAWTARHYAGMDWVLQSMLQTPADWARWSPGALGTVRVTTAIVEPGGRPEPIVCFMRFPVKGMIVDNLASGGLFANIDPDTGIMQIAVGRPPRPRLHEVHPDTRHQILGETVPHWEAVRQLAIDAHTRVPDLVSVAWDVALIGVQPVLLEANPIWNLNSAILLGETRWVEAMCNRLARRSSACTPWPEVI